MPCLMSWMKPRHEGMYRRIEVITGRRQRRNWSPQEKARILEESEDDRRKVGRSRQLTRFRILLRSRAFANKCQRERMEPRRNIMGVSSFHHGI